MEKVYFLRLKGLSIFQQLQIEEALLRCDERNWCIVNEGVSPAIVMGISGKPELLIDRQKIMEKPVPVVRRFSGGGTVFVDPSTFFVSWICNRSDSNVDCCPQKIGLWTEHLYRLAWPEADIRFHQNDYVNGDKKVGGNAQYLRKGRWLHHSSFLWDYQLDNMNYLLMPQRTPHYREKRAHGEFLCRLKDFIPCKDLFEKKFLRAISDAFTIEEKGVECAQKITEFSHRQATQLVEF